MSSAPRAVVAALLEGTRHQRGVFGVVIGTEGSTYAKAGALLSLGNATRLGWVSGGCLEPALEAEALRIENERVGLMLELDTRDDMDLMFGTRMGCRGLLRIALLPMSMLDGIATLLRAWQDDDKPLFLRGDGASFSAEIGDAEKRWEIDWQLDAGVEIASRWQVMIAPLPRVLVLGAGPETQSLLRYLRDLGARVDIVESRPRWLDVARGADRLIEATPEFALADAMSAMYSAVLVMNHDFERDRQSLGALAETRHPWIGLLGPPRRRDDLLGLLSPAARESLTPRLHAPVGIELGGRGPEVIALSIAAQLQMLWSCLDE